MTVPAYDDAQLRIAAAAAVRAPSLHNSQPWRFEPHDGGVDVFADRDRQLPVTDPAEVRRIDPAREMLVSMLWYGYAAEVPAASRRRPPAFTRHSPMAPIASAFAPISSKSPTG